MNAKTGPVAGFFLLTVVALLFFTCTAAGRTCLAMEESGSSERGIFDKKDDSEAHWVKITFVDGAILEGGVLKGRLYERPSPEGFVTCREGDEEAGIRLWYSKGNIPWRYIPSIRIKNVFTIRPFDAGQWRELGVKWEAAKSASMQSASDSQSKSKADLLQREKAYFELIKRRDPAPATADVVKDTGHIIKGATLAVTLDSTGHNTHSVEDPAKLADPDLLAYFLGYRPEDKAKLMAKKSGTGSLAQLSVKDRQFLTLYDRWMKLYGSATPSPKTK